MPKPKTLRNQKDKDMIRTKPRVQNMNDLTKQEKLGRRGVVVGMGLPLPSLDKWCVEDKVKQFKELGGEAHRK